MLLAVNWYQPHERLNKRGEYAVYHNNHARLVSRALARSCFFYPGLKLWAVACFTGYCFLSYTDGGFVGDPKLRGWASCPLGRTCRMVLFVLVGACDEFATQLRQSGTYIAMDNFFSSPILFLCLLWHGIFAVGTLKDIHRGASQAVQYWTVTRQTPRKKGEMVFARFGFLAFAQWKDSKLVRLLSTIHVKKSDFIPIPSR